LFRWNAVGLHLNSLSPEASGFGLKDGVDAIGVLFDVCVEFHGQQPGFIGIAGVKARLELLSV
jgi:hypothetical protein|tara:strand:- start:323 stop:511 length:189 start_codon:yes stop_codon:yes gene_type:complete